jgi:hypothetical protein
MLPVTVTISDRNNADAVDSVRQTSSIQAQGISEAKPVNIGHESLQNKPFATSHNKDRNYEMGAGSCAI